MSLTAEEIKAAPLQVQRVETPEWGGDGFVFVRELPGTYASRIVNQQQEKMPEEKLLATWAGWCLCDESGVPLFGDTGEDGSDVPEWLIGRSFSALSRVGLAAIHVNKVDADAQEETGKN